MKILSMDTSSKICSVSILEDNNLITYEEIDDEKTHSQKLMPLIDKVLKTCKLTLKDINLLACSIGPGSFTGVRIGVSTVKAFSDVENIPIASINSLESLAYNSLKSNYLADNQIICTIIDAKNDNVYFAVYKYEKKDFICIEEPDCKNINEVIEILQKYSNKDILFIGDGAINHKYTILQKFSKTTFIEDKLNNQSSESIGICAFNKYNKGLYGDSNSISPLYLRKSQAERALEGEK